METIELTKERKASLIKKANSLTVEGDDFLRSSKEGEASDCFLEAAGIFSKLGKDYQAGINFQKGGDFSNALKYFEKAVKNKNLLPGQRKKYMMHVNALKNMMNK